MPGKVWLVGAGPGAPDLLTLRAADLLRRADIVLHDALVHPGTVALAERAELVDVGKRAGSHSTAQRFICKRLVEAARKHRVVVRLKGGDPMLFGRAREEIDALVEAGIEYEVVPGVTAAFGASAQLGVSLTERGVSRSVLFVTPRFGEGETEHDWVSAAVAADTAVIYMARGQAASIASALTARGLDVRVPVAVLENVSWPEQDVRFGRLGELARLAASLGDGPALIVVGQVLRDAVAAAEQASGASAVRAEHVRVAVGAARQG